MFRERIEVILQETLFEPSALLETTVAEAMTKVLEIRDSILERTKKIRQKDESITICPDQDVNQDQFLTTARMEVMTVLLSLIEQEAATPEKLQVSKRYFYALSFYRSQNVLCKFKFFVSDQKFIYVLCQSQTFCARQKDDLHSVKLVFVPMQKFLSRH